ncbi:hypothetical protein [Pseudomonas syringae group sp. J309-1]|uniref:hypothetical protein n=1 Tax=Pseudomonas syringae group sp. J309-1 TaxID=3079588 RepID=UPI0029154AD2|nr:hypothetical protein [Pseudomonas syringae group sp. J309-1]MDU8360645.1 hypothetical protein [Pseudomonas syringae group sp. J309-1]
MTKHSGDVPPPIHNAPHAGMVETFPTGQVIYLAPLPLPTDLPAQDYGHAVGDLNDTYLDFGVGLPAVFGWQMTLGGPFWAIWFFGLVGPALAWLLTVMDGEGVELATKFAMQVMPGGFKVGGWTATAALTLYLIITFNHLNKYHEVVPTRFNRQRREVCFVPNGQTEPIFVPWESLSAWVVQARSVTQYGMDIRYAMGVGFYHPPHDEHYSLEFFCGGFDLAVCNWEAIRAYMEYEVHTLKEIQDPLDLQNPGDPLHEGLHTFYNARERMRRRRKNREVGFFYPFWWYTYHVLTLWTLPNYLTEWEIRRIKSIGRAAIPEAMQSWSESLPEEQWAKPSEELLSLSQAVKAQREKRPGQNLASRFAEVQQADRNVAKRA